MEAVSDNSLPAGAPELTELGKRIEKLRIDRGLSKQHLARHAGTSRQQLWRVMTGKSELSGGLGARLTEVLGASVLSGSPIAPPATRSTSASALLAPFAEYLADPSAVARTLATIPGGPDGRRVKRRLLDSLEDEAITRGIDLDAAFFDLRRRVLAGEL
ncbi:MAG TPA: helix-turn-helix transcriptional regulator [Gemmatimonadaceae bacterium]